MCKRFGLVTSLLCTVLSLSASAGQGGPVLTLRDCYDAALKHSEIVAMGEEQVRQAEAEYGIALGSALPEFKFSYELFRQDQSGVSGSSGALTEGFQREGRFTVSKKLLTGYRELAAVRGGGSHIDRRKFELDRARQLLSGDVARAYFGVLRADLNLTSTAEVRRLVEERLAEVRARVRVGRSRPADLISIEHRLTMLEAKDEDAARDRAAAGDFMSFLTGMPLFSLAPAEPPNESDPPPLDACLLSAAGRPDVLAKRMAVDVARSSVRVARSGHLPSIDLTGNYYVERPAFRESVDWDVSFGITVPLWSFGAVQRGVERELALLKSAELEEREALRRAELEIRESHRNLISSQNKARLMKRGREQARRQYEMDSADYLLGRVTNFEVLEALNLLLEAELAYNTAGLDTRLSAIDLQLAQGVLPGEMLP